MEEVKLQSKDGVVIPISRRALKWSTMLCSFAENDFSKKSIKLQMVSTLALAKVVEYVDAIENFEKQKNDGISSITANPHNIPKIQKMDDDESVSGDDSEEEQEPDPRKILPCSPDIEFSITVQLVYEYKKKFLRSMREYRSYFLKSLSLATLIEVIKAANYLGFNGIFDFCCEEVVNQMMVLSPLENRKQFNDIRCHLPPEYDNDLRRVGLLDEQY